MVVTKENHRELSHFSIESVTDSQPFHCLPPLKCDELTTSAVRNYFLNTWELYNALFRAIVHPEALYHNPDPLRHPLIFYLGHTAAFYINKMVMAGLFKESERIHPEYEVLFAQGVDPARAEELGKEAWPKEQDVWVYRKQVKRKILDFIEQADFSETVTSEHPYWSLMMGLEHDRIHFETSSMLIRQYPVDWLQKPEHWHYAPIGEVHPENAWLEVAGGSVELGKPNDFPTFGWDNEYGQKHIEVKPFEATKNLITNGEFLAFVKAGGYTQPSFWSSEGWSWREEFSIAHPRFWREKDGKWWYRAMWDELSLPMDWPAEVNGHEAEAYCRWAGGRLLTEAEFVSIANRSKARPFDLPFGDEFNVNLHFGSPCPVGMLENAHSIDGFTDVWGNVWNWLSDDYASLDGFEVHPLYEDFSAPYMDNEHATLLGGSWASSGTSASRFYRLWFRRYFYQHAGFRMAR